MSAGEPTLDELRREIDRIDNAIHDLLMQRTRVVHQVSRAKTGTPLPSGARTQFFRPGREAKILQRLADRHEGAFPAGSLARIWREIMSGQLRVQTEVTVAVHAPERQRGIWDTARDQYGAAAKYVACARPRQVVAAVRAGTALIGVLPMPEEEGGDDGEEPWWPLLAEHESDPISILSRLPVIADGTGTPALAIGFGQTDPSDRDRGCLVVAGESRDGAGVLKALQASGLPARRVTASHGRLHLVETDGLVAADDPRLAAARPQVGHISPVGGYAVPIETSAYARTEVA